MKWSRRRLLKNSAGIGLALIIPKVVLPAVPDIKWEETCKRWMVVLLPPDKYGPGADTPIIWKSLLKLTDNHPETLQWLKLGFRRIENMKLPETNKQLDKMLQTGMPYSKFLRYLRKLLVEYYYATEVGWHELGLADPPQPDGFFVND